MPFHASGPGLWALPSSRSRSAMKNLLELNKAGVRGIRFNLKRGGSEDVKHLDSMARRVFETVGWHMELYADAKDLGDLFATLVDLPAVSVDHLGLSAAGLPLMIEMAERGIRVKASGFGRVNFDVRTALNDLYAANPGALMFGTDLPSPRAARPYSDRDFQLVIDSLGEEAAERVLYSNAIDFYRIGKKPG